MIIDSPSYIRTWMGFCFFPKKSTAFLGLVLPKCSISRQHHLTIILSDFRQSQTVNAGSAVRNSFTTVSKSMAFSMPIFMKLPGYLINFRAHLVHRILYESDKNCRKRGQVFFLRLQVKCAFHGIDFHKTYSSWWVLHGEPLWRRSSESINKLGKCGRKLRPLNEVLLTVQIFFPVKCHYYWDNIFLV